MSDPDVLAAELIEETAALACSLHGAVEELRRPRVALHLSAPVAAIFEQPPGAKPRHRAGRPSAELVALAADAAAGVRRLAGYAPHEDNPALEPLALASFYVVDARRNDAFGLQRLAAGTPLARVLDAEEAHRDPVLPVGTALIRVWSELSGEPPVCVELRLRG
ncbi:MAG TPA: hypothetical protein VFD90_20790 [Gaiellales bacterium]|jgi:hypothetical protein|nr:hypothetical protein [Gaiellales bacterium]